MDERLHIIVKATKFTLLPHRTTVSLVHHEYQSSVLAYKDVRYLIGGPCRFLPLDVVHNCGASRYYLLLVLVGTRDMALKPTALISLHPTKS